MNLDKFNDFTNEFSESKFGTKIVFTPNILPNINEITTSDNIFIKLRQRYIRSGQIDNLIVSLSKKESLALGFWILSANFQRKYNKYILKLNHNNSSIKEIWLTFENYSTVQVGLQKFIWRTSSPEEFVENCQFYLNQKISIHVTNKEEDWITIEEFYNRDVLKIFGEIGSSCLMAEFFLNLGLNVSDVNYEYIKHKDQKKNLADEDSCEIRAELFDT